MIYTGGSKNYQATQHMNGKRHESTTDFIAREYKNQENKYLKVNFQIFDWYACKRVCKPLFKYARGV